MGKAEQGGQRKGAAHVIGHRQLSPPLLLPDKDARHKVQLLPKPWGTETHCRALQRRPILRLRRMGRADLPLPQLSQRGCQPGGKPPPDCGPVPTGLQNAQPQLSPVAHRPGAPEALSRQASPGLKPGVQRLLLRDELPHRDTALHQWKLVHRSAPSPNGPAWHNLCPGGAVYAEIRRRCSCPGPAAWWCRPWRGRPGPQWSSCTGGSGPAHCRCSALWLRSRQ